MDTWFELWDSASASLVGTCDSRDDALGGVRHSIATFGAQSVRTMILSAEHATGQPVVIASGDQLA